MLWKNQMNFGQPNVSWLGSTKITEASGRLLTAILGCKDRGISPFISTRWKQTTSSQLVAICSTPSKEHLNVWRRFFAVTGLGALRAFRGKKSGMLLNILRCTAFLNKELLEAKHLLCQTWETLDLRKGGSSTGKWGSPFSEESGHLAER